MKTTTAAETGTLKSASTESNPLDAFEAGLKSQTPVEVFPGIFIHHKDLIRTDLRAQFMEDAKATEPGPINPAGTLTLLTPESFGRAITDHRDDRTKVFADNEKSEIIAVFDFLEIGGIKKDSRQSGWGQLRAAISFAESRKLKEWRKTLDWMNQMDFANFLEDHLEDVLEPSGQHLLEIATDLEASSTGGFKGKVNLDNGSVRLSYQDEVETTVEVPRKLTLGIPLFEHGDRYKLGARLRFVIQGGSVKFRLLFTNLQDAKEQEFERIVQEIEEKTSQPIYRGRLALPW
jgi:uncharacterized protein YfdQ (DUF2303 family)